MNRRRVIAITGLIVAGGVINVAVAWSTAVATDIGHGRLSEMYTELGDEHHWEVYRWDNPSGTRVFSKVWSGIAIGPYNHGRPDDLLAGWGRTEPPDHAAAKPGAQIDEAWGLPMRSMSSFTTVAVPHDGVLTTTRRGVITLRKHGGFGTRGIHLSTLPLWGGFLGNTLVYALVIYVIHAAVRDITRAIRRRREILTAA